MIISSWGVNDRRVSRCKASCMALNAIFTYGSSNMVLSLSPVHIMSDGCDVSSSNVEGATSLGMKAGAIDRMV